MPTTNHNRDELQAPINSPKVSQPTLQGKVMRAPNKSGLAKVFPFATGDNSHASENTVTSHKCVQTDDTFAEYSDDDYYEDIHDTQGSHVVIMSRKHQHTTDNDVAKAGFQGKGRPTDSYSSAPNKADLNNNNNNQIKLNDESSCNVSDKTSSQNSSSENQKDSATEVSSHCAESSKSINEESGQESQAPTLKVEYVTKVWDAYINDFLLGSEHIQEAAIYDKATKSIIACSSGFRMDSVEFDYLLQSLGCLQLANKGVTIGGKRYKTVLADGRRGLMAKRDDLSGCSACQTRTLVILALHDRTGKGRRCNEELMRLGDFFWVKGL